MPAKNIEKQWQLTLPATHIVHKNELQQEHPQIWVKHDAMNQHKYRYRRADKRLNYWLDNAPHDFEGDFLRTPTTVSFGSDCNRLSCVVLWDDPSWPMSIRKTALQKIWRIRQPIIARIERLQRGRSCSDEAATWLADIVDTKSQNSVCAMLDEFISAKPNPWSIEDAFQLITRVKYPTDTYK